MAHKTEGCFWPLSPAPWDMGVRQMAPRCHAQPKTLGATYHSSHGLHIGPRPQPRAGTNVPTAPAPNKLHRTVGFGKFLFSFPTHFRGWGVFQDSDTFVNKEEKKKKNWGSREPVGREVTPAVHGQCLAPSLPCCPRPMGATGRCLRYLDYLSSIYICICLSPPTRPPPCSSSSFPINARRPAAHSRTDLPRPEPLPWAAPGRHLLLVGGARGLGPPPAPPRPAHSGPLRPPLPPFSHRLWKPKGRKGREKPDTHKRINGEGGWGQRDTASLGWGLEVLGREGRQEGQREEEEKWRKMNRTSSGHCTKPPAFLPAQPHQNKTTPLKKINQPRAVSTCPARRAQS